MAMLHILSMHCSKFEGKESVSVLGKKNQIILIVTVSRKFENKRFLLNEEEISSMKDRMCKVWNTVMDDSKTCLSFKWLVWKGKEIKRNFICVSNLQTMKH